MKKYTYILLFLSTISIVLSSFSTSPRKPKQEDPKKAKTEELKKSNNSRRPKES